MFVTGLVVDAELGNGAVCRRRMLLGDVVLVVIMTVVMR
jgi:hypothetical protein